MVDENERINTKNTENKSLRDESQVIEETTFYIDGDEFEVINIVKTENEYNDSCESNCSLWAIGENSEPHTKENDSVENDAKILEQNSELSNGILADRENLGSVKQVNYVLDEPHEQTAEKVHDNDRRKFIECEKTTLDVLINENVSVDTVDSETGENEDTVDNAMNYKKESMQDEIFSATETESVKAISCSKVRMHLWFQRREVAIWDSG